jgi:hypothetical protein
MTLVVHALAHAKIPDSLTQLEESVSCAFPLSQSCS